MGTVLRLNSFFAKSTHTPQFEFWLWTSSTAFATTTWVVTMVARQRMQMRMPRLAHFYNHVYSVGDTRQKKEEEDEAEHERNKKRRKLGKKIVGNSKN